MAARKPKPRTGVQLGEDVARNMIVAGSARVFALKGFRAASVEDLLEAAKVSRRTFYRLFESKEDVALALYIYGTQTMVEMWKHAIASTDNPLEQFARCIDIHLQRASSMGRLLFVLGGEASRQESPLHTQRMAVHDVLVEMLRAAHPNTARIDPLLVRTTIFALEALTRQLLNEGDEGRKVSASSIERARRVMNRLVTAGLVGSGEGVTPLPLAE